METKPVETEKNPKRVAAGRRNRKLRGQLTPKGRLRLSESALAKKPWEQSTGPRSAEGKQRASRNAVKPRTHEEQLASFTATNIQAVLEALGLSE